MQQIRDAVVDQFVLIFIMDADGLPVEGSPPATWGLEYSRLNEAVQVPTLTSGSDLSSGHTDNQVVECGSGFYRWAIPDAVASGGVGLVYIGGQTANSEYIFAAGGGLQVTKTETQLNSVQSSITNVGTEVLTKASQASVNTLQTTVANVGTEVDTKASQSSVDTVQSLLATKSSQSSVDSVLFTMASKASQTSVDALQTAVDAKSSQSSVDSLQTSVAAKASQTSVDSANTAIASKASQTSVDSLQSLVSSRAAESSITALSANVDTKASQTSVDALSGSLSGLATESSLSSLQEDTERLLLAGSVQTIPFPEAQTFVVYIGEAGRSANLEATKLSPGGTSFQQLAIQPADIGSGWYSFSVAGDELQEGITVIRVVDDSIADNRASVVVNVLNSLPQQRPGRS